MLKALIKNKKIIDLVSESTAALHPDETWYDVIEVIPPYYEGQKPSYDFELKIEKKKVIKTHTIVPVDSENIYNIEPPVADEHYIPVNEHLVARYSRHINGAIYERPPVLDWFRKKPREFTAPTNNDSFVEDAYNDGVEFYAFSHASVTIKGWVEIQVNNGALHYVFKEGDSNVSDGLGFIPKNNWTRIFHDDYTSVCFLFPPKVQSDIEYDMHVLKPEKNQVVQYDQWDFAFVCKGKIGNISDNVLPLNSPHLVQEDSIVVVGKRV